MKITPPIIISSPVRRSGTTLIQRLLTSDPNTMIYGESCANDFQMFTNFYLSKQLQLIQSKDMRDGQLKSVLNGNVNDWIPDLIPFVEDYLENMKGSFINLLSFYSSFAEKQNRPIWGMKRPEWTPSNLKLIEQLFPNFKTIYITRDIENCVRSAKKVNMVTTVGEIEQYCDVWKQHIKLAQDHLKPENTLYISYESLVENSQPIIEELKKFTGVKEIDASVMDFKFNTFKQKIDKDEVALGRYIEPADLTEEEMTIVNKYKND